MQLLRKEMKTLKVQYQVKARPSSLNERHNLFREDKNKLELAQPTISY